MLSKESVELYDFYDIISMLEEKIDDQLSDNVDEFLDQSTRRYQRNSSMTASILTLDQVAAVIVAAQEYAGREVSVEDIYIALGVSDTQALVICRDPIEAW